MVSAPNQSPQLRRTMCALASGVTTLLVAAGCGSGGTASYGSGQAVATAAKMTHCSPNQFPTLYATNSVSCLDAMVEWFRSPRALSESLQGELATPGLTPRTFLSGSNWFVICDSPQTCIRYRAILGGVLSPTPTAVTSAAPTFSALPDHGPARTLVGIKVFHCLDPNRALSYNDGNVPANAPDNLVRVHAIPLSNSGDVLTATYRIPRTAARHGVFYLQCGTLVLTQAFTVRTR